MKKDAYYFPHFCNARHDRKVMRLRKELGVEGYGIFFMVLEVLREQIDFKYPMQDIDLLAEEFGTSEQKVRTVICNYQLFELEPTQQFFSPKLLVYLEPYLNMKEQRRIAGLKSGEVRRLKAETPSEAIEDLPQVYIIKCFNDTEEFIKIGSTVGSISRRFSGHLPYRYEVLKQVFTENYIKLEEDIHNRCTEYKYKPTISFSGNAECYCVEASSRIIKCVEELEISHEHSSNTVQTKLNENEQSKVKESKVNKTKVNKTKVKEIEYTQDFEEFYNIYPNCFNKEQTFKNYKSLLKTETKDNILKATKNYIKYLADTNKTDKNYFVRSTNFVGKNQEYKGYLDYQPIIPVTDNNTGWENKKKW